MCPVIWMSLLFLYPLRYPGLLIKILLEYPRASFSSVGLRGPSRVFPFSLSYSAHLNVLFYLALSYQTVNPEGKSPVAFVSAPRTAPGT